MPSSRTLPRERTEYRQDRRSSARVPTLGGVGRVVAGHAFDFCRVIDISHSGLLFSTALPLPIGAEVRIDLSDRHSVEGRVVRGDGLLKGLQFTRPFDCISLLRSLSEEAATSAESEETEADTADQEPRRRNEFSPGLPVQVLLGEDAELSGRIHWPEGRTAQIRVRGGPASVQLGDLRGR